MKGRTLMSLRSPPKNLAYNLESGSPYPNPAMGALKSFDASSSVAASIVVYLRKETVRCSGQNNDEKRSRLGGETHM